MFIPKQILFWKRFNINFLAIFVGDSIPDELEEYKSYIILWKLNLDLNTAYVAQNLRMYFSALIQLPDDEMVMLTDMDMLPTNPTYYTSNLEQYRHDDFIYYRHVDGNQIYMCYNAAHPNTWSKLFGISNFDDIYNKIKENYIAALKDRIAELQSLHDTVTAPEVIHADETKILMIEKWHVDIDKVKTDIMKDIIELNEFLTEVETGE